jgi:uncharacterized phage protein gp47/JayE
MPWTSPTLQEVRKQNRDFVTGRLRSGAMLPNSVLRVLSDGNAGLAYLVLLYIDWLSKQLLPDTAETEWLDRQANIWVGGRKTPSFSVGVFTVTGIADSILPLASRFTAAGIEFEATEEITIGVAATPVAVKALDAGSAGNLDPGSAVNLLQAIVGVDGQALVVSLDGGADAESDDDLRTRVLERIRKPPMGGDADDYIAWAKEVPGVTRVWCAPNEMGPGTVTVRFMMDDLRANVGGLPNSGDVAAVKAYLDIKRPVAIKDFFVEAPVSEPINFTISVIDEDSLATRAAITASVQAMIRARARPAMALGGILINAQTIHREWVSAAILEAAGVNSFDLTMADHVMPSHGHIGVLGTITFVS